MAAPRPSPRFVPRRLPLDTNAVRQIWRTLADDARRMAASAVDSDGMALMEPRGFRHALAAAPGFPAERQASAELVAQAFTIAAKAVLTAQPGRRLAISAGLLLAAAEAVDRMMVDLIAPQLALSRRISGDSGED